MAARTMQVASTRKKPSFRSATAPAAHPATSTRWTGRPDRRQWASAKAPTATAAAPRLWAMTWKESKRRGVASAVSQSVGRASDLRVDLLRRDIHQPAPAVGQVVRLGEHRPFVRRPRPRRSHEWDQGGEQEEQDESVHPERAIPRPSDASTRRLSARERRLPRHSLGPSGSPRRAANRRARGGCSRARPSRSPHPHLWRRVERTPR
jgi:hypothetical protein